MCEIIRLKDGRTISTVGEFEDHFGPITPDMNPNHLQFSRRECLCSVNIDPLLRAKGFKYSNGDWWEKISDDHHTEQVFKELTRAMEKHPEWPTDLIHRVAIVAEEAGELVRSALNHTYEGGSLDEVRKECIQTAAMCYRLLIVLEGGEQ